MRDNLMGDRQGYVSMPRLLPPSVNLKLATLRIQPWVGLPLESGNGEKPPVVNVSERQV
jgi:hypothetical protein